MENSILASSGWNWNKEETAAEDQTFHWLSSAKPRNYLVSGIRSYSFSNPPIKRMNLHGTWLLHVHIQQATAALEIERGLLVR